MGGMESSFSSGVGVREEDEELVLSVVVVVVVVAVILSSFSLLLHSRELRN